MAEAENEKGTTEAVEGSSKENSKKVKMKTFIIIFLAVIIFIVSLSGTLLYVMISQNFNNIAFINRTQIEKIPIFKNALPLSPDPDAVENLNDRQLRRRYSEIVEERNTLRLQLQKARMDEAENKQKLDELQKYKDVAEAQKATVEAEKTVLAEERKKLEKDKAEFTKKLALGDTQGFQTFYQALDENTAKEIYASVTVQDMTEGSKKELAGIYENMTASSAARVLGNLADIDQKVVIDIMRNMNKEKAGEILAVMDTVLAAKLSVELAKSN